jgi:RNA polymerase sigma-70 factor (ECF subfamily)
MFMAATDAQYVTLCLNSHPDAFRQLVRRYQAPLISYLTGRLGDADQAEEAAQETFVRAFFRLKTLRASESFFGWLLGIARRVAQEQCRAERRYRAAVSAVPPPPAPPQQSEDDAVHQTVAKLPPKYMEVVLLRYYGGLSCSDVAEQLNIPLGTVTKRLSRAYDMLRDSLLDRHRRQQPSEV